MRRVLPCLAALLLAAGCAAAAPAPEAQPSTAPAAAGASQPLPVETAPLPADSRAFKGWELYSWQDRSGEWRYALVEGTNRIKSPGEITAAAIGEDELERRLAELQPSEHVSWCPHEELRAELPLAPPPAAVVARLVAEAQAREVRLEPCPPDEG